MPSLAVSGPPNKDIAEDLAKKQREIAVSEFFERNRQVLGYDSPTKALITAVKEGVENAIDACEEAEVLPEIGVEIRKNSETEFTVIIEDNGPGIVKKQVPLVFAKLLYGSRFFSSRQSLHPQEEVCLIRKGRFQLMPISAFVDRAFEEGEEGALPLVEPVLAPSFSWKTGQVRWSPVTHLIRHRTRNSMVSVKLDHGGLVRVTGNHSLFSFSAKEGIHHVRASDLKEGDFVLVPKRLPEMPADHVVHSLNLIDHVPQGLAGRHRWYVYGVPSRLLDEIERSPTTRLQTNPFAKRPLYHYLYRDTVIPVERFRISYRPRGFLPLWFIQAAGLARDLPGTVIRTYQTGTGRPLDLPTEVELSPDLAWLLGLYVAEGHAGARQSALTLGLHEEDLASRACEILARVLGVRWKILHRRNSLRVLFFSDLLANVLNTWCGAGSAAKQIPEFIFRAPAKVRAAFLSGLYSGDGSDSHPRRQLSYKTVSRRLATGLTYLWRMQGVVVGMATVKGGSLGRHPRRGYQITAFGDDAGVLADFPPKPVTRIQTNRYRLFPAIRLGIDHRPRGDSLPATREGVVGHVLGVRHLGKHVAVLEGKVRPSGKGRLAYAMREKGLLDGNNRPTSSAAQLLRLADAVDWFGESELLLARVRTVEESPAPAWVYDLSVPGNGEDENFVAGSCGPAFVKNTRGQQGLGISGAIMYGQITTGKPAVIRSKTPNDDVAYQIQLRIDTRKNKPDIVKEEFVAWERPSGTRVEIALKGRYISGKQSVAEYLKSSAIVNPHARITFRPPEGDLLVFERVSEELPRKTVEIKPHPYGIELGTLLTMAKETTSIRLSSFLQSDFSRISSRVAKEICDLALVAAESKPRNMTLDQAKAILEAVKKVKIMAPESDCLSPIGERLIKRGMKNVLGNLRPEFYAPPLTREPAVYSGHPFQVEVGIVFGGDMPADQPVEVLRFANRVPLLYQAGACATSQAVANVDWRRYGLEQRGGQGIPYGPAVILVHIASVKVPYTSEAKEAIAPIPELLEETELALKECGRRLKTHLNKKERKAKTREKFDIVQKVLPQIAAKSAAVVGKKVPNLDGTITKIMGVVWVEPKVEFTAGVHHVSIEIHNFTSAGKKFNLHVLLPRGATVAGAEPKPYEIKEDGKVSWELKRIGSVEREMVTLEVAGLDKDELDDPEIFASGISPELVIGAEPLPGDWDLNYHEFETEEEKEAAPAATEAETEVDYDEAEEALPDD